ncbi:MAG: HAD family hydrolase [Anaeroplasmataceae bacterium]
MTKVAFMYDFDKTLCDKDMQEYSFIPNMNVTANEFWEETSKLYVNNEIEKILAYMYCMMKYAKRNNVKLTREYLNECGKNINLFKGVETWFTRINRIASSLGLEAEHYIISSGLKEIIEGSPIAKYFQEIYSCEFHYDKNGEADFPAYVVNYTMKTQFLFRISKGAFDLNDDVSLNSIIKEDERRVRMKNMIYFGDGLTDIPCMRLVKENNGTSIAVYQGDKKATALKLLNDNRCNFISKADYSENSEIEAIVRKVLNKIAAEDSLDDIRKEQRK